MKNKYTCSECGNEIIFIYETPSKAFCIKDGALVREDNNFIDSPELVPYCSYDKEHNIEPPGDIEFWRWVDDIEVYFKENGLYDA